MMKLFSLVIIIWIPPGDTKSQHNTPAWYQPNFLRMATQQYQTFKKNFKRSFTENEDQKRFQVFRSNLVKINNHNSDPNRKWNIGVNQFSDMTKEEFKETHACYKGHQSPVKISTRTRNIPG